MNYLVSILVHAAIVPSHHPEGPYLIAVVSVIVDRVALNL